MMKFKPEYHDFMDRLCSRSCRKLDEKGMEEYLLLISRLKPTEDQRKRAKLKLNMTVGFLPSTKEVADAIKDEIRKDYVPGTGAMSDEEFYTSQIEFYENHIDRHLQYDETARNNCLDYVRVFKMKLEELKK